MFEGLKKRLSNFMDSVVSKEKAEIKKEEAEESKEQAATELLEEYAETPVAKENTSVPIAEKPSAKKEHGLELRDIKPVQHEEVKNTRTAEPKQLHHDAKTDVYEVQHPIPGNSKENIVKIKEKSGLQDEHREKKPAVGAGTKLKGMFFSTVRLKETDIDPFVSALKMGLLESDVNYDVVEKLTDEIKNNMLSKSISSKGVDNEIRQMIRESIRRVLAKRSGTDILEIAKAKKASHELPLKILFIGPNGAGKTTTMAKMANLFITNGFTCVMSASDTFRAAAIEQTTFHADKLGIRVVKGAYGSDPASIAFDAIAHAKAHNVDVVLMDSAGRQETNKSLVEELKKMSRVTKPDMKIFIGESIAGNSLLDQVKALNEAVSIDGIILTKLDCDAKGGNTISLLSELPIPILFFGIGERYDDLMPYDPNFIIDSILPNN